MHPKPPRSEPKPKKWLQRSRVVARRRKDTHLKEAVLNSIYVFPGGREVCSRSKKGMEEYRRRIQEMAERQNQVCCLFGHSPMCHPRGLLLGYQATFEHEDGRGLGGGKRDDRIILPDGTWINGAAHYACNQWKGSRYINYNRKK